MKNPRGDTESHDLAVSAYAFQEKARKKILANLSERMVNEMKEKVAEQTPVSEKEMADSAENVLSVFRILQERGEIFSCS